MAPPPNSTRNNGRCAAGYFLMDAVSNSNSFDTKVPQRGEYIVELETRYHAVLAARQAAHHRLAQ